MTGDELKRRKLLFDGSCKAKNNVIYNRMCLTVISSVNSLRCMRNKAMLLNSVFLIACSNDVKLSRSWFAFSVLDFGFDRCY